MDGKTHFELVQSSIDPDIVAERRRQESLEYTRELGELIKNTNILIGDVLSMLLEFEIGTTGIKYNLNESPLELAPLGVGFNRFWSGGIDKVSKEVERYHGREMCDIERRYIILQQPFDLYDNKVDAKIPIPENCYLQRTLVLGTHDISYRSPGTPVSPEKHFNANIEVLSGFSLVGEDEETQLLLDNDTLPDPFKDYGFISETLKPYSQALPVFHNDQDDVTRILKSDHPICPVNRDVSLAAALANISGAFTEMQCAFEES